ncbi:MAG: extracellular solute-binding protein [Acidobacteria bacterium]|nr:extracellular solute-binding protein [Acidobacteriota bacterium]MCI0622003.1 extracellular solute-binding protein [Acidobacteriota bacterium]
MMDWQGFTTLWYRILFQDDRMLDALANSLWIALWTTLVSLLLGVPAGVGLARASGRGNTFFELLLLLPLIVPEIILAAALAGLYGFAKLRLSFWTIVTTHVAFSLSYVILMVRSRMARLDPALVEAAMDLGADERRTFFRVLLPHLAPAVLASSLMVFTISLDDYVITSFVAGAGNTTLPLQIYSMAKEGLTPEINAVCTLLMLATVIMAVAAQWAQHAALSWRRMMPALLLLAALVIGPLTWRRWAVASDRQVLNLYIWSGYLAPDTVKVFEQRFVARVQCDLYDSVEALLAKLQGGNSGYDIVVPSDYAVHILRRQRLLSLIDKAQIPNLERNLDPQFLGRAFDPENRYSIPYTWGTTGIGYRKDLAGQRADSWQALWEERYRGRIVMLDDMRENFGAALKLAGFSINSRNPEELQTAKALLEKQKPLLQAYNSSNFQELLVSGDAWLVQGWNGQIVKAARENPNIGYALPKEGSTLFIDSFCIPAGAPHKDLAHQFINYMLEPETAAAIVNHTGYTVANRAARPYINKVLLNNPALFPDPALLDRCEMLEDLGETVLLYDRLWTEVKSK